MSLLEVKNLHTFFNTKKGIVKAVNDVTYSLEAGKTLGIVGESGSGKSVSAMSIIKLLDGNLSSDTHNGSGLTSTGKLKIHFGTANDSAEDYYYIQIGTATASALGVGNQSDPTTAGHNISTQENAQKALQAINNAIVSKDNIRAHLGALQNRLENTISNLSIQAENLQAAESRISDVDVATEMTNFVRNQILTQSAVSMLGQANSLPQMALSLIG